MFVSSTSGSAVLKGAGSAVGAGSSPVDLKPVVRGCGSLPPVIKTCRRWMASENNEASVRA